jgi:hypothetical protein
MPFASGPITKLFVKAKDAPDQYGNTHRAAVKIGDNDFWIGLGDLKGDKITVQMGAKNWVELTEGSIVEFLYTEKPGNNGNVFRDAKRSGVKVLELAPSGSSAPTSPSKPSTTTTPAASPSSGPTPRTGGSSNGTDWAKKDAGIEAGHAVNGAVAIVAASIAAGVEYEDDGLQAIAELARDIHRITREFQNEILAGSLSPKVAPIVPKVEAVAASKPTTAPKPKTKPAPEPVAAESWEEEEITPF